MFAQSARAMVTGKQHTDSDEEHASKRPGRPVEPVRVRGAVMSGKWWLLGAAISGLLIGVLVAKYGMRHSFETSGTIRYEGAPPLDPAATPNPARELPGLVEALRREQVIGALREELGLGDVSTNVIQLRFMQVVDAESGLITLTGHGDDPEDAARFVNTLMEVFASYQDRRRGEEIQAAIGVLDERITAAQTELDTARSAYDVFRTQHGIGDLTTEQQTAIEQAADLRAEAQLATAEVASLEARVVQLREERGRAPRMEVLSTSTASPDEEALAHARSELESVRGRLSPDHPRLQALEQQVAQLQSRVRGGHGSRVGSSVTGASSTYQTVATSLAEAEADLQGARQRSAQLATLAQEGRDRVAMFSGIEGEATGLLADVNVKEALATELRNQRARLTNLLEQPDAGFRVVARAEPPEFAVPSRRKYYVAAGVPILFVLVALIVILFRAFRSLTLHSAAEVAFWGRAPVVASTTWPRDPRALSDLVADLDDFVPDARGSMLVVGATEREASLAAELAKQLSGDFVSDATHVDLVTRVSEPPDGMLPQRKSLTAGGEFPGGSSIELLGPPTIVQGGAPYGLLSTSPVSLPLLSATPWEGAPSGQALRRAARLADRVLVIVPSGAVRVSDLTSLRTRLGRDVGIGYVLTGVTEEIAQLPDRCGPVDEFWSATREAEAR